MGTSVFSKNKKELVSPISTNRLCFSRDKAGWNNVRITFESLVCAARLTNRMLVLPPASYIDHLADAPFHELHVYDSASLASVISFEAGQSTQLAPNFSGSLNDFIRTDHAGKLGPVVTLSPQATRIQHFECLSLSTQEKRLASETVLAMRFADAYEDEVDEILRKSSLTTYHGVHLRRGDFARFRPETQWSGADLQGRVRSTFPWDERGWPLVVACFVTDTEHDPYPELAVALHERCVLRTDELYSNLSLTTIGFHNNTLTNVSSQLKSAVLDTILMIKANRFAGTPESTFSTGVWHWRARDRILRKERPEAPVGLGSMQQPSSGKCWQRCTDFAAITCL